MDKFMDQLSAFKTKDELEKLKHQLFLENVKIQSEKAQIESEYEQIHREKKAVTMERRQLQREKKQLSIEMNELREQVEFERKRLKEDEKFIEKKQRIIEHSYELMQQDRLNLTAEKERVERERDVLRRMQAATQKEVYSTGVFFRGVNNPIALKKRYKDLLKIYHPDNICGDSDILLKINREYEELRDKLNYGRQA